MFEHEAAAMSAPQSATPSPRRRRLSPWPAVAVLALLLAAGEGFVFRQKIEQLRQEFSQQAGETEAGSHEMRGVNRELRERLDDLQERLAGLESQLEESQAQRDALRELFQDVARGREEATLLEIEQALTLATQQLQLAGNVGAATLAVHTADARLSKLDRPQYLPLRKALAADLKRLQAVPAIDVAGISMRLEQLVAGADKLPLAAYGRPVESGENAAPPPGATWWQAALAQAWQEVRGLVRIQRFDGEAPALLAPGQALVVRENLKLRLLNARLALLSRDGWTFRNEVKGAQETLTRYFDANEAAVRAGLAQLQPLAAAEVSVTLPDLNASFAALRALRPGKDKR